LVPKQTTIRIASSLAIAAFGFLQSAAALAQGVAPACGSLQGGFGPYDYRTAPKETREIVESAHFTLGVETLRAGNAGTLGGDISYTLGAFPNHPRALLAMSNLSRRLNTPKPPGARWTIDCYFDRALRWRPDDPSVRLVYGIHLTRSGQKDAARAQLMIADRDAVDEGGFHYNLGLAFLDLGDSDRALMHAWRAYALGYDLPGLKRRLEKMGKWREPEK
jgi:predicted Zn-dependent protease